MKNDTITIQNIGSSNDNYVIPERIMMANEEKNLIDALPEVKALYEKETVLYSIYFSAQR